MWIISDEGDMFNLDRAQNIRNARGCVTVKMDGEPVNLLFKGKETDAERLMKQIGNHLDANMGAAEVVSVEEMLSEPKED